MLADIHIYLVKIIQNFVINVILFPIHNSVFLQQHAENILQAYPVQQPQQHKPTFNTDQNLQLAFPPNPDIVQSIEVHSFDDPVIASPSQQTREDNSVDETVILNDTLRTDVKDNVLNSTNDNDIKRLKRESSNERVTNTNETNKYKPRNKLKQRKTFHNQAYKLSKLSNGYKNKINPKIPPLETWPFGMTRVPRSAIGYAGKFEELTETNSEEIQSGGVGKVTGLPKLYDYHKERNRIVVRSIPQASYNTRTYQVHELSDEESNQDSSVKGISINNNASQHHNRMRIQQKNSEDTDSTKVDKKSEENTRALTDNPSSYLPKHNGTREDVKNTPVIVQDRQDYSELERNAGHMSTKSVVDTDPSYGQGQITSSHGNRRDSDNHAIRLKHHSLENNNNEDKIIQENKQNHQESETNESNKPRKQIENREFLEKDDNVDEYSIPGFKLNEEHEQKVLEQKEHVIASNKKEKAPLSSVTFSDTLFISPERGPPLSGVADSDRLQVEQKTGYKKTGHENKNRYESDNEELVTSSEENEDEKESHETLQAKSVMQDHNSQNKEHSQHNLEGGDRKAPVDEEEQEEDEDGGIYETISKILQKKDAISREEDVAVRGNGKNENQKQADTYRNYWVLEYSRPKFSK
jgi:hypothetical protein